MRDWKRMTKGYRKYDKCNVENCDTTKVKALGLCDKHWNREYYSKEENRKRRRELQKKYRSKIGKSKLNKKSREWYQRNIEHARSKRLERSNRENPRWTQLKTSIRKKRDAIKLNITETEFKQWASLSDNKKCYYCSSDKLGTGHGVDRIDSNLSYSLDNIRACCKDCNRAKAALTEQQFEELIYRIYENFKRKTSKAD